MFRKSKADEGDPSYLKPYAAAAKVHGSGFGTLLWQSAEGQAARFEVIAEFIEPTTRVVADLGCGRADLLAYLVDSGRTPRGYVGVDGIPEMFEAGRAYIREHAIAHAECIRADFVADSGVFNRLVTEHGVDGFVFSGSLNTLVQRDALALLDRAFGALPRGGVLVFNFLSNRIPGGDTGATGPAHRFDTLAVLDWSLTRSPLIRFRHDYLGGHDATIAVKKL